MSPLRWATKSTRKPAAALTWQGHRASADAVVGLWREEDAGSDTGALGSLDEVAVLVMEVALAVRACGALVTGVRGGGLEAISFGRTRYSVSHGGDR